MAGKRRKHPKVRLKWDRRRTDEEGRSYARLRWTKDGLRESVALGFVTEDEAEARRQDQEAALRLGVDLSAGTSNDATVDAVIIEYLAHLDTLAHTDRYKAHELAHLNHVGRHLGSFLAVRLTATHMQRFVAARRKDTSKWGRPFHRSTVMEEVQALQRAWRVAKDLGRVDCPPPPTPDFKSWPEDKRPARELTEDEVRRLIAAAYVESDELGQLFTVHAWSGRRPVAVFDLRIADLQRLVDPAVPRAQRYAFWRRDKGGIATGWGPLTGPAYEALVARVTVLEGEHPERHIWRTYRGNPWNSTSFQRPMERVRERAEVDDVQLYDLRKFACSSIYDATGNVKVTMQFSGHKKAETLLRHYVSAPRGRADEVAASIGWTPAPLRLVDDEG